MWFPGQAPLPNQKIGVGTLSMWALCFVAIGVCYKLEEGGSAGSDGSKERPPDVQQVLPSGAWLMKDGSIKKPRNTQ
eukprot:CAMPEP_0119379478 /NCGR_PEP_ID=MMETSP1334-20130426/52871_1 /TAXON_ID=127549 /ORGANISM="Calcidiscus leptoporus, Strain RCC1130" /LENGTH=76 /DNA_ID=CAMNT_0007398999 /DNA_START=108 /DNA_END=338 /DNA_ORIENTATION=-